MKLTNCFTTNIVMFSMFYRIITTDSRTTTSLIDTIFLDGFRHNDGAFYISVSYIIINHIHGHEINDN